MDLTEARSILAEIIEHDTPDAADACRTVLDEIDRLSTNYRSMAELAETTGQHAAALCEALDLSREAETDVAVAEIKRLRVLAERHEDVIERLRGDVVVPATVEGVA